MKPSRPRRHRGTQGSKDERGCPISFNSSSGARILRMRLRLSLTIHFAAVAVCLCTMVASAQGQGANSAATPETGVVPAKLSPPIYPPLARQAAISGDVKVELRVRKDGSVESVEVVSGHPMLKQAALEAVQKSQFECRGCNGPVSSYSITFSFQFRDDGDCCNALAHPQEVLESQGRITISFPHGCLCDPTASITLTKWRSAKCLYLWRCGSRVVDSR